MPNKKRQLVYQVKIETKPSNLYNFCVSSVADYCKKHNIEHIVQTKQILNICPDPKTSNRSHAACHKEGLEPGLIIYEKENAFDYLDRYDQITIIDSDIYIRPNSRNIFDELPEEYDFGAVVERDMPITDKYQKKIHSYSIGQYKTLSDVNWKWRSDFGAEFYNMGVMVFNSSLKKYLNGHSAKEFIRRPEFKKFVDGLGHWKWSTDQTLLNYWIKKAEVKVKNLDWRWNTLYKGVLDSRVPEAYFVHFFLRDHLPNKGENIQELMRQI